MSKKINPRKLPHDFVKIEAEVPDVGKTTLTRLAGIVTGARTDIVKRRGKIVSLLPVVAIVFINTLNTIPFFFIQKIPVVGGSPIVGLLIGIISVIPFIGRHSLFIVGGSFLIIGSVLWFYFLRYITKRTFIAFFTVVAWISPLFMKPVSFLGISIPYILYSGFLVEDISSVIGLSLMPVPLYFILLYLRKHKAEYFIKSVIGVSAIAFISPLSLFNLLILAGIIGYSEMMLGQGRVKFIRLLSVLISGILITFFWYHPVYSLIP